jgi:3'(2'), 5'-bisphosphate nucleotidase
MSESPSAVPRAWMAPLEAMMRAAGEAILTVYNRSGELHIETKPDDSPLTAADRAAHDLIAATLARLTPEIPMLSEESAIPGYGVRARWSRYWLVDPLDGTKEFISRNGEFTVNVALVENQVPILGLVYAPVPNILYGGVRGQKAWRVDASGRHVINSRPVTIDQCVRVVTSRRHGANALKPLLSKAAQTFAGIEQVNIGSSLKICMLAEAKADWYPRLAPTSEWDTAAAQAVLEAAGGVLVDEALRPLRYNTKDSLLNPYFHALGDADFDWRSLLT